MARTDAEIVARINFLSPKDPFGFTIGDLIFRLPFAAAKPFLKPDAVESEWEVLSREPDFILKEMRDYLNFAWDKANNCRGLSAGRSIAHFQSWLWLYGEDKAADELEHYNYYGKPHLAAISEWLGVDWRSLDGGDWVESEDGVPHPPSVTQLSFTTPAVSRQEA